VAVTQAQVDSADITAVVAQIGERKMVIVSMYIPDLSSRRTKEENLDALTSRLDMINELVTYSKSGLVSAANACSGLRSHNLRFA
jgi:phage tail sheath gpL-like